MKWRSEWHRPGRDGAHEHLVRADGADLHVVDDELAGDLFENRSFHDRGT